MRFLALFLLMAFGFAVAACTPGTATGNPPDSGPTMGGSGAGGSGSGGSGGSGGSSY